ncbi:hypothetical protein RHMOL_Rhmol01G0095000 [Rhododendron molle]|uniref:Uncharacterized protein n=1 Tax=Rhododendron molle TaxID=49168 RepID=A0ACC0Q091_RHOML|nr:hypothetical protein RHMOL_Rhmol01G0095000 [Rhododendron molle]
MMEEPFSNTRGAPGALNNHSFHSPISSIHDSYIIVLYVNHVTLLLQKIILNPLAVNPIEVTSLTKDTQIRTVFLFIFYSFLLLSCQRERERERERGEEGERMEDSSKSSENENPEVKLEEDDPTRFSKSLQELKDLCSQLHYAADYCETSFVSADRAHQKNVVQNTKEYLCRAVVTVVDHLGSVSANLDYRLSNDCAFSETEFRINGLKQAGKERKGCLGDSYVAGEATQGFALSTNQAKQASQQQLDQSLLLLGAFPGKVSREAIGYCERSGFVDARPLGRLVTVREAP